MDQTALAYNKLITGNIQVKTENYLVSMSPLGALNK